MRIQLLILGFMRTTITYNFPVNAITRLLIWNRTVLVMITMTRFLISIFKFFLPTDSFVILNEAKHLHVTFIWQPEKSEDVKKLLMIYQSSVSSFCYTLHYFALLYFALLHFTFLHCNLLHLPEVSISTHDLINHVTYFAQRSQLLKIQNLNLKCLENQKRPSNLNTEEMCACNSMVAFWGTHISSLVIYVLK